uniref:Triadin n=1 Tax=Anas platyrhynchos platyrhynchos TaxID=8840 RepID=A0A493TGB0_ANAPP
MNFNVSVILLIFGLQMLHFISSDFTVCLGRMSMTTTIIDGKNGSVPSSSMKVGKKSVTEDLVTTFSSPAAWLLVVALIVTWSAVAIVMFDLVDYKAFAATYSQHCDDPCLPPGRSVNKLSTEPLRIIHETLEESTDWLYGFISLLSDIIWSDDDDTDEGEVESSLKKVIHRDKPEKQEKIEKKEPIKVTHKDKTERQEKPEKKEKHTAIHKEKSEKPEKHEKKAPPKVIQKDKPERHEKAEKKTPPKGIYFSFLPSFLPSSPLLSSPLLSSPLLSSPLLSSPLLSSPLLSSP